MGGVTLSMFHASEKVQGQYDMIDGDAVSTLIRRHATHTYIKEARAGHAQSRSAFEKDCQNCPQ